MSYCAMKIQGYRAQGRGWPASSKLSLYIYKGVYCTHTYVYLFFKKGLKYFSYVFMFPKFSTSNIY